MRKIGIEARVGGPDHAVLLRGDHEIGILPLREQVHPAILRALLVTLGLAPADLVKYLEDP